MSQISCTSGVKKDNGFIINSNEQYIRDLYSHVNVNDPKAVFHQVFSNLPDSVVIYPSEGFYYFHFQTGGQSYIGSFAFLADTRDQGLVYFGYSQKVERTLQQDINPHGASLDLSLQTDITVEKLGPIRHRIKYNGKAVVFKLYKPDFALPKKAKLAPSEIFIGPTFDESGIQFYLLFDSIGRNFLWLLNDDVYVPEEFKDYKNNVTIGLRSGFAFYQDMVYSRKILIGVQGWNVFQNNWFDGPFDHLPDNYIYDDLVNLKRFIEKSNLSIDGAIDKYGNYIDDPGNRVAISPYRIYYFVNEFDAIIECEQYRNTSEFYNCITQ